MGSISKRIGYGLSAAVLGLSAVSFYPSIGAAATTGGDFCTEEEKSPCYVMVTSPDLDYMDDDYLSYRLGQSMPLTIEGEFNGDLVAYLDGEPVKAGALEMSGGKFTLNLDFDTPGEYELMLRILEDLEDEKSNITIPIEAYTTNNQSEFLDKMAKVGESFSVEVGIVGDYGVYKWYDEYRDYATPKEVKITQTGENTFDVMPLVAGQYEVHFNSYVMIDGEWYNKWTVIDLTAFDVTTEAAETIVDVMEAVRENQEAAYAADNEYREVLREHDYDEEDEEVIAAREKADKIWEEQLAEANRRTMNAFGEDAGAILEAAYSGKTISTDVSAVELDAADVDEEVKEALLEGMDVTFASNVKYYDIDVNVYADGEYVGTLKELTNTQVVVLSGFEGPAAGFNRVFKVLGYHTHIDKDGNEQAEIVEVDDAIFDAESGTLTFDTNKFSTYAVSYNDALAASVNTGMFTWEGASAASSVASSVVLALVAVTLFGVYKFAHIDKKA